MKICTRCGRELDITQFSRHCKSPDGHRTYCKSCAAEYQRRWYVENRDSQIATRRAAYDSVKEAERYQQRKGQILAQKKIWRATHKEYMTLKSEERRARQKALPASLTQAEWEEIKVSFNNECAYCGRKLPLERDHIIPLTKGGAFAKENIVPACKSCNSSKGNRDLIAWYKTKTFYTEQKLQKVLSVLDG